MKWALLELKTVPLMTGHAALLEMAIFSLILWCVGIDRSKKKEQKCRVTFLKFWFFRFFSSLEFLKNFIFVFYSSNNYTNDRPEKKKNKKCGVTFFQIFDFLVVLLNFFLKLPLKKKLFKFFFKSYLTFWASDSIGCISITFYLVGVRFL